MWNRFLLLNLFLAMIPVLAAYVLVRVDRLKVGRRRTVWLVILGTIWMAFLPNSCYLMTEWRHFLFNLYFQAVRDVTNPNDLSVLRVTKQAGFFLGYSGFGMLCFYLAIRPVAKLLKAHDFPVNRLGIPFFFLVSLGVYLGLILRLNSWDLLTHPWYVVHASILAMTNFALLCVISAFAGVLGLLFVVCDIWFDGLTLRLSRFERPTYCDTEPLTPC